VVRPQYSAHDSIERSADRSRLLAHDLINLAVKVTQKPVQEARLLPNHQQVPDMERRRQQRTRANTRQSLERALGSWVRIRGGWQSVLDFAQGVHNWEQVALAESKLGDCQTQIVRIEALLTRPDSAHGALGLS
jgi:hypothetical protein